MSWAVVWWSTCHSMWHLTCSVLPEMTWHLTSDTRPFSRAAKSTFASLLTMMDAFLYCGWSTSCKGFISGQGEPCKFSFQVMGRSCAPQKNLTWKLKICKKIQKKPPKKTTKKPKQHIYMWETFFKAQRKRGKDWDTEMEEGDHRCARAWSDTSHYGVNCSNGDVVLRAQRSQESDTCVHMQEHAHTEEMERTSGYVPPA